MNKQPSWKDPIILWSHKAHFTRKGDPDVGCDHGEGIGGRMWTLDAPPHVGAFGTSTARCAVSGVSGNPPQNPEATFFTSKMGMMIAPHLILRDPDT